jgi:hypothetical protein
MNYVKIGLDWLVGAMNFFPNMKTKAGAVLQVIGTAMVAANYWKPDLIPSDVVMAINTAATTLVAVGAANQPANNTPSA